MGKASDFTTVVNIPHPTKEGRVVMVSVRDVSTPMDIQLLPRGEEPIMLTLEACKDPAFPLQTTDFAYLSVRTDKFVLSQPDTNMWSNALIPLDLMALKTLLNQAKEGNRWYTSLKKHFFDNPRYFESSTNMALELAVAERKIEDNGGEGWWTYIKNTLGTVFLSKTNAVSSNYKGNNFLKWLWREARSMLDNRIPLTLNTNLPINPEFVCTNPTDMYLRFTVTEKSMVTSSLASLFSTLPSPIPPRIRGISTGTYCLPKDPFIKLSIQSNLCQKHSLTGKESVQELHRLFTGDLIAGFKKGNTDELLSLALAAGSHTVHFKVVAEGAPEITYDTPGSAQTSLTLLFWEIEH